MVKRKREEPRLEVNLQKWEKDLVRGLKTAKGFERQRYAKRQREADPEKAARLEREIAVLKSIDLHQAAHQHLCSSLLKIKGIAESPNLPEFIKPIPKPDLTEDERTALHNVTSALCNRKHVKDVVDEAIMGTCIALRVPMPEKKGKGKGKNAKKEQEEQSDDAKEKLAKTTEKKAAKEKLSKSSKKALDTEDNSDGESWDGFGSEAGDAAGKLADSDAEEKAFSRFDDMLGSSSDGEDGNGSDDDAQDSRARSIRGPSDYFSGSEAEDESEDGDEDGESAEEESDEEDESDSSAVSPPPKKAKSKAAKPVSLSSGNSTFLPSLMGGYVSGSESDASDIDVAPPMKKNRRGQRARQAIWEKKFKKEANHVKKQNEQSTRDQGWDMKKGAIGEEDSGPWKKGISNPFEKRAAPEGVHPDRQANFDPGNARQTIRAPINNQREERNHQRAPINTQREERNRPRAPSSNVQRNEHHRQRAFGNTQKDFAPPPPPQPRAQPKPKKDDEGPLHASWAAAKKAKEDAQKVSFQGKKITFD